MTSIIHESEARRQTIIDGINEGLSCTKIAFKLGLRQWVVKRDLKQMHYKKDPELKKAIIQAQERLQEEKKSAASLTDKKFQQMTGMTFKEKTFSNMMSFYEPELVKILKSGNECDTIRELPKSVRRTLRLNGIIVQGWKTPEVTDVAREYIKRKQTSSE